MSVPDAPEAGGLSPEGTEHLVRQVIDLFVEPEVRRRQKAGTFSDPATVFAAQVVLRVEQPPEVRLNDEVRGQARARASRPVDAGKVVTIDDVEGIEGFTLVDSDDPNAAHITMLALKTGWAVAFDTRYNAERIAAHVTAADEFIAAAETSTERHHLRSFVENAFSATELLVKAELLSVPDGTLLRAKKHGLFAARYNEHAKQGNADLQFAALLNDLQSLRGTARYLRGDFSLDQTAAREMLNVLGQMRAHIDSVRPIWPRPAAPSEGQEINP